jgi:hypothetical protein
MNTFQAASRLLLSAVAIAALAVAVPAVAPPRAAALTNCIEIGPDAPLRGCWENVWVDGVEYRMTFFGGAKPFNGNVPAENMGEFYVIGPQTDMPQSLDHPFMHDHVVAAVPRQNGGEYTPIYQGILVLCSEQGILSGACVPTFSTPPGGSGPIPLATTVNGQPLTSVEAVEAAAAAGLVVLFPAGPLVGAIGGNP